jgi:hypothetical protein
MSLMEVIDSNDYCNLDTATIHEFYSCSVGRDHSFSVPSFVGRDHTRREARQCGTQSRQR